MNEFDEKEQKPSSDYQEPDSDYKEPTLDYQEPASDYKEPSLDNQEPAPSMQEEQPSNSFTEPHPAYPEPPPVYQAPPPPPGYQGPPPYGYQAPPPGYQGPPPYGYAHPYSTESYNRPVGFIEAYKAYWLNAFNFNDRTTRSGYWWAYLMNIIIMIILSIIVYVITFSSIAATSYLYSNPFYGLMGMGAGFTILIIFGIVNIVPGLAIFIRRLHDTGKAWYWVLLLLIPFANFIIWIVLMVSDTILPHENQFGELEQV